MTKFYFIGETVGFIVGFIVELARGCVEVILVGLSIKEKLENVVSSNCRFIF